MVTQVAPVQRIKVQNQLTQHWVLWITTAIGLLATVGAYWEALGRFSVTTDGQSYGCGSPFLGRWFQSDYDPMATLAVMCGSAAPERRLLTFVLGGIGLGLQFAVLGCLAWSNHARRVSAVSEIVDSQSKEPPSSRVALFCLIGIIAGVFVLAGAGFAIFHASSLYGFGSGNTRISFYSD